MGRYDTGYRKVRWVLELLRDWSPSAGVRPSINQNMMHTILLASQQYLIEEFDKLEYEGPTVGPAKMIRDAKN